MSISNCIFYKQKLNEILHKLIKLQNSNGFWIYFITFCVFLLFSHLIEIHIAISMVSYFTMLSKDNSSDLFQKLKQQIKKLKIDWSFEWFEYIKNHSDNMGNSS